MWLRGQDGNNGGEGGPRRFDSTQLVNNEIIGSFIDREFLDPEDDRVLDELLAQPVAGGLTIGDLVPREALRDRLRQRRDAAPAGLPPPIPVSPQRRLQATRKRLAERANSVVARILDDLDLSRPGREVAGAGLGTGPGPNAVTVTKLLNQQIREFTGKKREDLTVGETEAAYQELDRLGDAVRDRIREALGRNR